MNPHIDYSWVPPQLSGFLSGMIATLVTVLVILLIVAVLWWVAAKLSGNFFISQGRAGLAIIAILVAASLIVSLPAAVTWGSRIDPTPDGIAAAGSTARGTDTGTGQASANTRAKNRSADASLSKAGKEANRAAKSLGKGDLGAAAKSAVTALKDAASGLTGKLSAGLGLISDVGVGNLLKAGAEALRDKAGQLTSQAWAWLTGG
jgi:hypothetical protein